ncbi:hypothetical protein [Streptomyces sp. NPDC056527]|uniref:hypothetical protein n=1 Tax=Streptomyces sp. NPDC056527 TaxID=3345853 RepID=UPI003695BFAA
MSEWGIALIAAGSAILGSSVTGFFAWKAGHRQAAAAEAAGQAQANALIATVQATLDEQRRTRADERRRQVYAELLTAGHDQELDPSPEHISRSLNAYYLVEVEGPGYVANAALGYLAAVNESDDGGEDPQPARAAYIEAIRRALDET